MTRVWVDGVFDLTHYGHLNAIRLAAQLGDDLVAGISPSADVALHKGCPTVLSDDERKTVIESCRWVKEVVCDIPWTTTLAVLDENKIDFCAHGSDTSTDVHGNDTYAFAKAAGRFKVFPRTEGISTTGLIQRMLSNTRVSDRDDPEAFITLSRIKDFSEQCKEPRDTDTVVYVEGSWDLFHAGHVKFLEAVRQTSQCTFLLVGVHSDDDENRCYLNAHERTLAVAGCRYVDNVVMGAPVYPTPRFLERFHVSAVYHGSIRNTQRVHPRYHRLGAADSTLPSIMVHELTSPLTLTASEIAQRVRGQKEQYEARNKSKLARDVAAGIKDHGV
eukprot:ANDGO_00155.mRNA.1 Ethanolamine-phosphate cytidylyltransferase